MVIVRPFADTDSQFLYTIKLDDIQQLHANTPQVFLAEQDNAWQMFVIERAHQVVGYFKIDFQYSREMRFCPIKGLGLGDFVVDPKVKGQGIGTAAIHALIKYSRDNYLNYNEIYLTVNCHNLAALHCYLKGGFNHTGKRYNGGLAGPQFIMKTSII